MSLFVLLFILGTNNYYEIKREIITFEKPFAVLVSPILNSIVLYKKNDTVSYSIKGDTLFPLLPISLNDTLFLEYRSFFYRKDTTVLEIKIISEVSEDEDEKFVKKSEISEDVEIKGEKTVSFLYSDRGFKVDQKLSFEIEGKLTEDYFIRGKITDESYPEGESFTRTLSELEEASINLEGSNIKARIGEFTLKPSFYEKFKKELIGLEFSFMDEKNEVNSVLGYPKGVFRTFYVELKDVKSNTFLIVDPLKEKIVPGSERVFLDGIPLKRGREFDYIVDYTNGTITLTQNVSYSLNSKLRVDFEVLKEGYSSYFLFSEYKRSLSRFDINFVYLNESDIPSMPRFSLTESDKNYLKNLLDTSWILLSGINYVDSGKGNYILRNDTLFYVGEKKGNINPSFVFVGPYKGDYDYVDGKNYFLFVGKDRGSYKLGRWAILPQRNQNLILSLNTKRDHIKASYLSGFSFFSPNLFTKKLWIGYFNDFNLNFENNKFGFNLDFLNRNNFRSFFRIYDENFSHFWGKSIKGDFYDLRIKPYFKLREDVKFYYGYSVLRGDGFLINKNSLGYSLSYKFTQTSDFELLDYGKKNLRRLTLYVEKPQTVSPFYSYFFEIDTVKTKIVKEGGGFKVNLKSHSFIYEIISFRLKSVRELKNNFRFSFNFPKLNFRFNSSFINFRDSLNKRRDFNYFFESNINPKSEVSLSILSSLIRKNGVRRVIEYIKVPEGRGSYSYDSLNNTYYPDPDGSYIKRVREVPVDLGLLRNENDLSGTLNFERFFYNLSFSFKSERGFESKEHIYFTNNLNFYMPLNPSLNLIFLKEKNKLFDGYFINGLFDLLFGLKKNYDKKILELSFGFKNESFEELNIVYKKRTPFLYISPLFVNSNRNLKLGLTLGLSNFYYLRPIVEKVALPYMEFSLNFSSDFLFNTKIYNDFSLILKRSYDRSFSSNFEKDKWRYINSLRVEKSIRANTLFILKGEFRRGSFSHFFYNIFLETKLLF
ncbi:MAG: hypothetical protein ABDH49_06770 [Candidatus Hydrothermales bacterium]